MIPFGFSWGSAWLAAPRDRSPPAQIAQHAGALHRYQAFDRDRGVSRRGRDPQRSRENVTNRSKESASAAAPTGWEHRVREATVLMLIPLIVYLGVCLYTYHPGDPGWSHAGSDAAIRNLGGSVGAWIADLSLYFFGAMAFAFPLMLAAIAWRLIRDETALPGTRQDSAWLLLGAAGWIASGSG